MCHFCHNIFPKEVKPHMQVFLTTIYIAHYLLYNHFSKFPSFFFFGQEIVDLVWAYKASELPLIIWKPVASNFWTEEEEEDGTLVAVPRRIYTQHSGFAHRPPRGLSGQWFQQHPNDERSERHEQGLIASLLKLACT